MCADKLRITDTKNMFGTYRTLLALMVVALHLGGIPTIGAYAVFGFYCISGYLMTLIMQTNYGYTVKGIGRYALNRFLRIYPIYWFSILFSFGLIWFLGDDYTSRYHPSIYLPKNYSELINNIIIFFPFRESPRLTPPAWALTVEIFFYILIGVGISRNRGITMAWFTLSLLYHVGALILHAGWNHRYFTIPAASLPFSTGALIFNYNVEIYRRLDKVTWWIFNYIPFFLFASILINCFFGISSGESKGVFFYINYILCALMMVSLLNKKELPFISKEFDKLIGGFSYSVYLIHYQIGVIVLVFLSTFGVELKRPSLTLMSISIPFIFLFSFFIAVTIERPIEMIREKIKS